MRRRARLPNQKSISYFNSLTGSNFDGNSYVHMFQEDIRNGVVPYRLKESTAEGIKIIGKGPDLEKCKSMLSSFHRFDRRNEQESIFDAIREMASDLLYEGESYYEVWSEDQNRIYIQKFTSKRLLSSRFGYFQFVPKAEKANFGKSINYIPHSRVWRLAIPHSLGGAQGYRHILRDLSNYDIYGPQFWKEGLEANLVSGKFNFKEYHDTLKKNIYLVTRKWGWNLRNYSTDTVTEYYNFHRILSFRSALAELREGIVSQFNGLLRKLGIDSGIFLGDLLMPGEISSIARRLFDGEEEYGKILEKTKN